MVAIYTFDSSTDSFTPLQLSRSERLEKVVAGIDYPFKQHEIPHASENTFLKPILQMNENHTEHLADLWGRVISEEKLATVTESSHIRTLLAYPLIIDQKVSGMLVLCFNREYGDLSQYEKDSLASLVDVTAVAFDRARLYQELEKLNGDLTDSNKQQVTLIHFITHQLKGFVAKSRNIFSMIQEGDYGEVPESMKPIVAEGFASSTKGAQTIQEILNAANIKSGQVAYSNAAFDFKASMNAIVASLKPNADAKGVALTIAEPDTEVMFTGDQMQMENAIKNLIDNSIKYTPQGSITVTLTKDAGTIRLVTEDTGVGITPEDMARLFTEGGHGAESQKVNVDSTGFGLYIVKNIVEGHKGKVWAESEGAGKGSKFIVELPAP
jgi:signal transduction histidine kinase